jgi:hypothetical protein
LKRALKEGAKDERMGERSCAGKKGIKVGRGVKRKGLYKAGLTMVVIGLILPA